jgi:poly(3-hydroxybutyrate) depolymerase
VADICGLGQTEAAHNLCTSLPPQMCYHHAQLGVGRCCIFNGRR